MRALSPEVTDRTRSVNSVLYTLRRKGPGLAAKIHDLAEPLYGAPASSLTSAVPPGTLPSGPALSDTLPDFLSQLGFLERAVESAINELARRDLASFDVERLLTALRAKRDEQVKVVYGKVVKLRYFIQGEFEDPDLELLGLRGATPTDPTALRRVAENFVRVLLMPNLEFYLGKRTSSEASDVTVRANELQVEVDSLRDVLDAINNALQDQQQAQVSRKEGMAEYDRTFIRVARILEDYFLLAGDEEMAERVRPSRSRPGRTEVDPDVPGDGDDAGRSSDDGSEDDGSENDGSEVDGSEDDGSEIDGSEDDGPEDDGGGGGDTAGPDA